MAGRGGRGRGRGPQFSFNTEQLGFSRGDALPTSSCAPPPTYPDRLSSVPEPEIDHVVAYQLELKSSLESALRLTMYEDNYYEFAPIPAELRPHKGTKRKATEGRKIVDVSARLYELEKREQAGGGNVEEDLVDGAEEEEEETPGDKNDLDDDEDAEEPDEEMDEGTDYVNSHFSDGGGYEDEDDNLEPEATY